MVYAATTGGIYITRNGGNSWSEALNGSANEVRVASDGTVFASVGNQIRRSRDKGMSWDNLSAQLNNNLEGPQPEPNLFYKESSTVRSHFAVLEHCPASDNLPEPPSLAVRTLEFACPFPRSFSLETIPPKEGDLPAFPAMGAG